MSKKKKFKKNKKNFSLITPGYSNKETENVVPEVAQEETNTDSINETNENETVVLEDDLSSSETNQPEFVTQPDLESDQVEKETETELAVEPENELEDNKEEINETEPEPVVVEEDVVVSNALPQEELTVSTSDRIDEKVGAMAPHWIHDIKEDSSSITGYFYLPGCKCSICGFHVNSEKDKCPGCGAYMK